MHQPLVEVLGCTSRQDPVPALMEFTFQWGEKQPANHRVRSAMGVKEITLRGQAMVERKLYCTGWVEVTYMQ